LAEYGQVPIGFTVAERFDAQTLAERATPGAYAEVPNEVQLLWRK
jgi:hypothetical protein